MMLPAMVSGIAASSDEEDARTQARIDQAMRGPLAPDAIAALENVDFS